MKGAALVVLVASLLAACAIEPPVYTTPSAGSVAAAPPPVPAGPLADLSVGLVLTDNTRATVTHLEATAQGIRSFGLFTNTTALEDAEPRQIVDDLTRNLGQRFRSVQLADTAAQAVSRGDGAVLTVDVRIQMGTSSGQITSVSMSGQMAGRDGTTVDTAEGQGQGVVPYPAFSFGFRSAWQTALAQFMGKLDASPQIADLAAGRSGKLAARSRSGSRPGARRGIGRGSFREGGGTAPTISR